MLDSGTIRRHTEILNKNNLLCDDYKLHNWQLFEWSSDKLYYECAICRQHDTICEKNNLPNEVKDDDE